MSLYSKSAAVWKLLTIAVGSFFVMVTFAVFPGILVSRFVNAVADILPSLGLDSDARRLVRFIFVRVPELTWYACAGIVTFRYLARMYPIPMTAGEMKFPPRARFLARVLIGLAAAASCASIGVVGNPSQWLAPFIVFLSAAVVCFCARFVAGAFSLEHRLLYLRRFSSFADRAVVSTVLRSAPWSGAGVAYLISSDEPAANWDPWIAGFGGLKWTRPLASTPVYLESAHSDWKTNVRTLIRQADCIVMDVSDPSASIAHELETIAELGAASRTVVIVDETRSAAASDALLLLRGKHLDSSLIQYRRTWLGAIPRIIASVCLVLAGCLLGAVAIADLAGVDIRFDGLSGTPLGYAVALACTAVLLVFAVVFFFAFAVKPGITRESRNRIRQRVRSTCAMASPLAGPDTWPQRVLAYYSTAEGRWRGDRAVHLSIAAAIVAAGIAGFVIASWLGAVAGWMTADILGGASLAMFMARAGRTFDPLGEVVGESEEDFGGSPVALALHGLLAVCGIGYGLFAARSLVRAFVAAYPDVPTVLVGLVAYVVVVGGGALVPMVLHVASLFLGIRLGTAITDLWRRRPKRS